MSDVCHYYWAESNENDRLLIVTFVKSFWNNNGNKNPLLLGGVGCMDQTIMSNY